jgi:cytochrome P450
MCYDLWCVVLIVFSFINSRVAGQETTSNTLAWGFAYLIHNPEVQTKCHAELDRVVGSADKMVTLTEKPNLHYCNAVINVSDFGID